MSGITKKRSAFWQNNAQLLVPLIALGLLVIFNLFRDPGFFSVELTTNNDGNPVLQGNLISILNGASELVILAMGMTLVTAASGGQDISVGCLAAIAGSVFVRVLKSGGAITPGIVLAGVILCCLAAMAFGAFNGTLVAVFRIQPMIATLILFTCGRSIAYWINGGATPTVDSAIIKAIGSRSQPVSIASLTTSIVMSVVKRTEWISRPVSPTCIPELSHVSWALRGATDSMLLIISLRSTYAFSSSGSSTVKSVMPALMRMLYHWMSLRMSDG